MGGIAFTRLVFFSVCASQDPSDICLSLRTVVEPVLRYIWVDRIRNLLVRRSFFLVLPIDCIRNRVYTQCVPDSVSAFLSYWWTLEAELFVDVRRFVLVRESSAILISRR